MPLGNSWSTTREKLDDLIYGADVLAYPWLQSRRRRSKLLHLIPDNVGVDQEAFHVTVNNCSTALAGIEWPYFSGVNKAQLGQFFSNFQLHCPLGSCRLVAVYNDVRAAHS